ncbi:AAA family ATPase [candidate division KSB1 bacterium]|nr:AAA family ATPase [candidate division KSB1 bacterium]
MKALFVAASGQDAGKTTTCIGLFNLFHSMGFKTGFIKPVGQSYVEVDDLIVDKDSLLMKVVYDLEDDLQWMSPVIIPSGFTTDYIKNRQKYGHLQDKIVEGFEMVARDKDVVIVEGTGHAGVGSIINLSNATVAKLIGASAILVAHGGIGSSIDEVTLNAALFQQQGVEIIGVVINKVLESKYDKIKEIVADDLQYKKFSPLGFLPYKPLLSMPHMYQIKKRVNAELLSGEKGLNEFVEHVAIAAMAPQNMLPHLKNHSLVITPGDRVDNILVTISSHLMQQETHLKISGLLLTGGFVPDDNIMNLLKKTDIPVLRCEEDTYTVASKVFSLTVKTQASDLSKLEMIKSLYLDHIDQEALIGKMGLKG